MSCVTKSSTKTRASRILSCAPTRARSRVTVRSSTWVIAVPTINDVADSNRPNPDHRAGDNRTLLSGTMGLRYRTTSDTALNFGTGMKWYTPYQNVTGQPTSRTPNESTYDISDPQISYDVTSAAGPTQLRTQVRAIYTTEDYYVNAGEAGYAEVAQYVKWRPTVTGRVILGAEVTADYSFYKRNYQGYISKAQPGDGNVGRYSLSFIPSFEYKLTDSLNFNTSLGYGYLNYRSQSNWSYLQHQLSTWRVGVGWAITHDIYINPYINFFAEAPAFNTASLKL